MTKMNKEKQSIELRSMNDIRLILNKTHHNITEALSTESQENCKRRGNLLNI